MKSKNTDINSILDLLNFLGIWFTLNHDIQCKAVLLYHHEAEKFSIKTVILLRPDQFDRIFEKSNYTLKTKMLFLNVLIIF